MENRTRNKQKPTRKKNEDERMPLFEKNSKTSVAYFTASS